MSAFRRDLVFAVLYVSLAIISLNATPHILSSQKGITGKPFNLLNILSSELAATQPAIKDANLAVGGDDSAVEEGTLIAVRRYLNKILKFLYLQAVVVRERENG